MDKIEIAASLKAIICDFSQTKASFNDLIENFCSIFSQLSKVL